MGPSGEALDLPEGKTIVLAGHGSGNLALSLTAEAYRAAGNRVIHFACYDSGSDIHLPQRIRDAASAVVWVTRESKPDIELRAADRAYRGDVLDAMSAFARDKDNGLDRAARLVLLGPPDFMSRMAAARARPPLSDVLPSDIEAVGTVHAPMQCMLKEVCGRCLIRTRDAKTGAIRHVFACAHPNLPLDEIAFESLRARSIQGGAASKLAGLWVQRTLSAPPQRG
jgi:hypothetical protein